MNEQLKSNFEYCEHVIKNNSKLFYKAFSSLPNEKRQAIFSVYAFCRMTDDAIDVEKNPEKLKQIEADLKQFESGTVPDSPVWRCLKHTFDNFDMNTQPFFDQIKGQTQDIHFKEPKTQENLESYAYYVAGSVGLMILPILSRDHASITEYAVKLGLAMQITNILRDVGEDYANGRIYFPEDKMNTYNVTKEDIASGIIGQNFIDLWEDEARIAENYYDESLNLIEKIDQDSLQTVLSAAFFYRELLNVIRENKYTVFNKKHSISTYRSLRLLTKLRKFIDS